MRNVRIFQFRITDDWIEVTINAWLTQMGGTIEVIDVLQNASDGRVILTVIYEKTL